MSPARSPGNARLHLKSATADQHRQLDAGFTRLDLKNCNDYRAFLTAQAAIIGPLERWLTEQAITDLLPDWPQRRRFDAIAADLAALGLSAPPADDFAGFARPTLGLLAGVAYVLEGSRLGAQYLSREVATSADALVRGNMRFLSHGAGQRLWPTFLEALESRITDAEADDDAARGAQLTFDLFLQAQRRHVPALAEAGAAS